MRRQTVDNDVADNDVNHNLLGRLHGRGHLSAERLEATLSSVNGKATVRLISAPAGELLRHNISASYEHLIPNRRPAFLRGVRGSPIG